MRFEITDIEFDFTDSFEVENTDQDLIDEVLKNLMRMISSKRSHLIRLVYQIHRLSSRSKMITSKKQMINIMRNCDGADTLTREQKFQVFYNVCDNMLKQGRMSKTTHKRFTEIW